MNKTLKILSVVFSVVLLLSGIAVFAALNMPVNAVDLTETNKWTDDEHKQFTYDGTPRDVEYDENYTGKYITVDGTKWYLISSADDLTKEKLGTTGGNFILTNSISMVRTGAVDATVGTIDGRGYTITFAEGSKQGLFNTFAGNVSNIKFEGTVALNNAHYGAIALWYNGGTITSVSTNVTVTYDNSNASHNGYVAGLVARTNNVTDAATGNDNGLYDTVFVNCTSGGSITCTSDSPKTSRLAGFVAMVQTDARTRFQGCTNTCDVNQPFNESNGTGGFVGISEANSSTSFDGCLNDGTIKGNRYAGGYVGHAIGRVTVWNCDNSGAITTTSTVEDGYAGGFIGRAQNGASITKSDNTGAISCTAQNAGGFVGGLLSGGTTSIKECNNSGKITGPGRLGGFVGRAIDSVTLNIENCSNTGDITGTGSESAGFVGTSWGSAKLSLTDCTNEGDVNTNTYTGGLVAASWGGTLTIEDSTNKGDIKSNSGEAGGLVGRSEATTIVTSSDNEGTVTAAGGNGGLTGGIIASIGKGNATITDCTNKASAKVVNNGTGDKKTGGIVGNVFLPDNTVSITGCKNYAQVTSAQRAGGIVGHVSHSTWNKIDGKGSLTISNCENAGAVKGTEGYIAGIIAFYESYSTGINVTVESCENSGAITATGYVGGIAGMAKGNITVNKCVNTGVITNNATTSSQSSGIVGRVTLGNGNTTAADTFTVNITNNANYGTINSGDASGGIIGCHNAPGTQNGATAVAIEVINVSNNFNSGKCGRATGTANEGLCGGIVNWSHLGGANASFKNNYTTAAANNNGYGTTTVSALQAASGEVAFKLGAAWGQTLGTDAYPVPGGATVYNVSLKATAEGNELAKTYSNTDAAKIIALANVGVEKRADVTGYRVLTTISAYDYEALVAAGVKFELGTIITADKYGVSTYEELKAAGKPYIVVNAINGAWYETSVSQYTFAGSLLNIKDTAMDYAVRGYIEIDGTIIYTDEVVVCYDGLAA